MTFKALVWNIKSVKTKHSFHRVQMLHRHHQFDLVALMEPFQRSIHVQQYKWRLGMAHATFNTDRKIWVFIIMGSR